jgi:hypothetical protein
MAAIIDGVVRDQAGRAVAGAAVYFTSSPTPMPDIAARSDQQGRFTLSVPQPGEYTLAARADGYQTSSASAPIAPDGKRINVEITLRADT